MTERARSAWELEQEARAINAQPSNTDDTALADIRADIRNLRREARVHFRWLLSIMLCGIAITIAGFVLLLVAVS